MNDLITVDLNTFPIVLTKILDNCEVNDKLTELFIGLEFSFKVIKREFLKNPNKNYLELKGEYDTFRFYPVNEISERNIKEKFQKYYTLLELKKKIKQISNYRYSYFSRLRDKQFVCYLTLTDFCYGFYFVWDTYYNKLVYKNLLEPEGEIYYNGTDSADLESELIRVQNDIKKRDEILQNLSKEYSDLFLIGGEIK